LAELFWRAQQILVYPAMQGQDELLSDDAILAQQKEIAEEITATQKQIGDLEAPQVLLEEYKENNAFHPKIGQIIDLYKGIRRSRKDGSCFYRSFIFAYLEMIKSFPEKVTKATEHATQVKNQLLVFGYPEFTVGDFHESYVDLLKEISKDGGITSDELKEKLRDNSVDMPIVYFTRLVTSASMQQQPDKFEAFCMAMGSSSVKQFCQNNVEPPAANADQLQITALTDSFQVGTRVVYLDGSSGQLNHHDFPDGVEPVIHLLYRPGHYDLLYLK
jgi:ubiquitin thioesterase protein OTUB1